MILGATPHLFRSAPAGASFQGLIYSGSTNLITTGLAADIGTVAIDSSGNRWFKYGSSNTAWVNLSALPGDIVATAAPSAAASFDMSGLPAHSGLYEVWGEFTSSAAGTMNLRLNAGAVSDEGFFYVDENNPATIGTGAAAASIGGSGTTKNLLYGLVTGVGGSKLAEGFIVRDSGLSKTCDRWHAGLDSAAALSAIGFSVAAGNITGNFTVARMRRT